MAENNSDKVIQLKHPLTIGGETVSELRMRRPKVRDLHSVAKMPPTDQEITLFANLCMIKPDDIEELGLDDYEAVKAAFEGFRG